MTSLAALIKDLSPNGVPHKLIETVCDFNRGKWIKANQLISGPYPVVTSGQKVTEYHNEFNRSGESITIASSGAYAGFVNFWNQGIYLSNAFTADPKDPKQLLPKFLFFFLKNNQDFIHGLASGGGVPNVYGHDLNGLQIPIPPVEIQQEIIRILETFTELEIELQAELEARQSEYEYYRHTLLSCEGIDSQELELGSVGRVLMCKRIMKDETSISGDVPFFKIGTFGGLPDAFITREKYENFKAKYSFPKVGSLLISAAGTIGKIVKYSGEPSYFQDSNIVWLDHDESVILNEYLFHCYKIAKWSTDTGSIPRLYNSNILKLKIQVPSIDDQKKIVSLLNKFENLTNESMGYLPAEIIARRQQYEYYRSKLLTFKELEVA